MANRDVIIADNDASVRSIVRSYLQSAGFLVLSAKDGLEAVHHAQQERVRLVILDYRMPRLNGIAACAEIRCLPGYLDVPIAILTAFDNPETRAAAERAGATAFIKKPFTGVELLVATATLLDPTSSTAPPAGFSEPRTLIWRRRPEPMPVFGEPNNLAEGRRVLKLLRG